MWWGFLSNGSDSNADSNADSRPRGDRVLGERHQPECGFDVDPLGDGRNNSDSAIVDVLVRYAFIRAGYGNETPATTRLAVLAASESIDDSVVVRVPSPGTYEFWVYVVDHSPSTTDHESERITVTVTEPEPEPENPEPACCPDLVVTKFSVSDTNPIAGSTLTLSATVRNIGTGASGGATLEYSVRAGRGERAARTLLAGLAASESIDDSVVVRVPSPGTYEYLACVRESTAPLVPTTAREKSWSRSNSRRRMIHPLIHASMMRSGKNLFRSEGSAVYARPSSHRGTEPQARTSTFIQA